MHLFLKSIKILVVLSIVALRRTTYRVTLSNGQWYRCRARTRHEAEASFGPPIRGVEVVSAVADD
jgi:hypothetical protein